MKGTTQPVPADIAARIRTLTAMAEALDKLAEQFSREYHQLIDDFENLPEYKQAMAQMPGGDYPDLFAEATGVDRLSTFVCVIEARLSPISAGDPYLDVLRGKGFDGFGITEFR